MITISVCDDEEYIHKIIEEKVKIYSRDNDMPYELFCYSSGQELLDGNKDYDILLLDIEMPGMDGIETAQRLIEQKKECKIIMLTSNVARFKEAFKIGAQRYVTKPIDEEELFEALDEMRKRLIGKRIFTFSNRGIDYPVMEKNIMHIMADKNATIISTEKNEYRSQQTIKKWAEILDQRLFFQCHRSFLVNMGFVDDVGNGEARLKNGERIPIARRKYNDFLRAFASYDTVYR